MGNIYISIDFELRWGIHHIDAVDPKYDSSLTSVPTVIIPRTLDIFSKYQISATWATVGAIACDSWDEYFHIAPAAPVYQNKKFIIDRAYTEIDPDGLKHFSPKSIYEINSCPMQEIGSHGFSHLFADELGVTESDFLADLQLSKRILWKKYNVDVQSFVYPRNRMVHLDRLSDYNIKHIRGLRQNMLFSNAPVILKKIENYVSSFVRTTNIENPYSEINNETHFVRFSLPDLLWNAHLKTITESIKSMNQDSYVHLWWHPHNLASDSKVMLKRLEELTKIIHRLCNEYGHNSVCMNSRELRK